MEQGKIEAVKIVYTGGVAVAAASIGASAVVVESVADFDSEQGGRFLHGSNVYVYDAVDAETKTVNMASTLLEAVEEGDKIYTYPLSEEKWALVNMPAHEDAQWARLPHGDAAQYVDGVRNIFDQESVWVDADERGWVIRDSEAQVPKIAGRYVDVSPGNTPGSDNLPPLTAPGIEAIAGLRVVHIRLEPINNDIPVNYEYHMYTVSGMPTEGDPATVIQFGPEASYTARTLPDGITKLDYEVQYFFRVFAHDADGYGPASAEVSAVPLQVNGPDVAVDYVYTNNLVADQITGGTMSAEVVVSGAFKTAATGQRAEMTGAGFYAYRPDGRPVFSVPTNPTEEVPINLDGEVNARNLTVEDDLEVRGEGILAPGSVTTLAFKTSAPTSPPQVVPGYPTRDGVMSVFVNNLLGWSIGPINEYYCGYFYQSSLIFKRAVNALSGGTSTQVGVTTGGTGCHEHAESIYSPIRAEGVVEVWTAGGTPKLIMLGRHPTLDAGVLRRYDLATWPLQDNNTIRSIEQSWVVPLNNFWYGFRVGPHADRDKVVLSQVVENGGAWNKIEFKVYNWETGALVTTYTTAALTDLTINDGLRFCRGTAHGLLGIDGTNRLMWAMHDRVHYFTMSGPTATYSGAQSFYLASSNQSLVTTERTNTAGSYVSLKSVRVQDYVLGIVTDYTEVGKIASAAGVTHYVTATWGVHSAGPTGYDYETSESKPKQFTWPKRGKCDISVPAIPNAVGDSTPPDSVVFYVGATSPSLRTNRWLQAELPPAALAQTLTSLVTMGVNAPSANSFPLGIPARLQSGGAGDADGPLIDLSGDNSGRTGWNRWDTTGKGVGTIALRASGDQSFGTSAFGQVLFGGTVDHDYGGYGVAASVITVTFDGVYLFNAAITWANNATGRRILQLESFVAQALGAGVVIDRDETNGSGTGVNPRCRINTQIFLAAGTKVRLVAFQNSGVIVDVLNGIPTQFSVRRIG